MFAILYIQMNKKMGMKGHSSEKVKTNVHRYSIMTTHNKKGMSAEQVEEISPGRTFLSHLLLKSVT